MLTVLVTDPEQRAALAAARSLARQGWRVITIGTGRGLAGASRATRAVVRVPEEVWRTPAGMRESVAAAVVEHVIDVVVPVTDLASRSLLGRDEELGARVAGPSLAAYERASDKKLLLEAAAESGLRVPGQFVIANAGDLDARAAGAGRWVVKPSRSVVDVGGKAHSLSVRFAEDRAALPTIVGGYPHEAFPLLVQERVSGMGIGVFLLRDRGKTLMLFGHRRLREKPPAGGVSTYREAMVPRPDLVERCERLLDRLEFDGPAMVEFKEDAQTGEAVLMEINARLWGSVQLAIDAGVDFPAGLVAVTAGLPIPPGRLTRPEVRTYWEFGELDHALAIWRKSARELSLPLGFPTGPRAAWRALRDRRQHDRPEVFRLSDPLPFLTEAFRWLLRR